MKVECICDCNNKLGESPVWNVKEQTLYWIDPMMPVLHSFHPEKSKHKKWKMPAPLHCIDFNSNGKLIGMMQNVLVQIDLPKGEVTTRLQLDNDEVNTPFNDGKFDAKNRFWIGTQDVKHREAIGKLFRIDIDKTVTEIGLGWSPDNKMFYFVDTLARTIYQYDFNLNDGLISNKRNFAVIAEDAGYPDGLYIDRDGNVWCAHWGGFRITCYSPNGKIKQVIELPVRNVTSCCIGGQDNKTLFITTASIDFQGYTDLGENAGGLFALEIS
jgi:sugar lactone lactonase YvrE